MGGVLGRAAVGFRVLSTVSFGNNTCEWLGGGDVGKVQRPLGGVGGGHGGRCSNARVGGAAMASIRRRCSRGYGGMQLVLNGPGGGTMGVAAIRESTVISG